MDRCVSWGGRPYIYIYIYIYITHDIVGSLREVAKPSKAFRLCSQDLTKHLRLNPE